MHTLEIQFEAAPGQPVKQVLHFFEARPDKLICLTLSCSALRFHHESAKLVAIFESYRLPTEPAAAD